MPTKEPRLKKEASKDIAIRLKALREDQAITLTELAEKLQPYVEINLSGKTGGAAISNIENRKQNLTVEMAIAYTKVFNVSLEYLFCLSDDMQPENKAIKEAIGLSDKSIGVINDLKDSAITPSYLEIMNVLYETGFITKEIEAFSLCIKNVVSDDFAWIGDDDYPELTAKQLAIWHLHHAIDKYVDNAIETIIQAFYNHQ